MKRDTSSPKTPRYKKQYDPIICCLWPHPFSSSFFIPNHIIVIQLHIGARFWISHGRTVLVSRLALYATVTVVGVVSPLWLSTGSRGSIWPTGSSSVVFLLCFLGVPSSVRSPDMELGRSEVGVVGEEPS